MKAARSSEFGGPLVFVAFDRPYIANPDLVQRFAENASLAEVDWDTVYGSGAAWLIRLLNLNYSWRDFATEPK